MSKISIFFGLLLVTLGLVFYVVTGSAHPTALIPTYLGVLLGILGMVALVPKWRKHAAHVAAVFGLLGFLAGAVRGAMTAGTAKFAAVSEQFLMGGICLVYLVFCVRSFISARKAMKAGTAALKSDTVATSPGHTPAGESPSPEIKGGN